MTSRRGASVTAGLTIALLGAAGARVSAADEPATGTAAAQPAPAGAPAASPPAPAPPAAPAAPASEGILPIPDYYGDIWTRKALLGNLNGARTNLAEQGVQFGVDWNNTVQSVVSGGRDENTAYGGTLDFNLSLDLMRMGVLPGALVKVRGESRYGESVNGDAGPLLPVNSDFMFPIASSLDEGVAFTLTTVSYTQFLSEHFAVFLGKFDTLDGDPNEFASGRGLTQFQNLNFVFNPTPLVTVPYDTLGGGLLFIPTPNIVLVTSIITTSDCSTTTGFDKIGDGWTWTGETNFQYQLGHLPGGFNVGGTYGWDNSYTTVGRRFSFVRGEGFVPTPDQDSSWSIYASAWQYLIADEPAEGADKPLDTENGMPDRKGLGLFARIGWADEETNPIELAVSGGIGGRGMFPGRDLDLYGVGVFYNQVQTRRLTAALGVQDNYMGVEAFYNIAVTPAAGLTLDVQVVEPTRDELDTAVVLGARFLVRF